MVDRTVFPVGVKDDLLNTINGAMTVFTAKAAQCRDKAAGRLGTRQ